MDNHKELIERLKHYGLTNGSSLGRHMGIMDEAADALSALITENRGLKANKAIMEKILEGKHNPHDMELINQQMLQNAQLRAELEQMKRERSAEGEVSNG